MTFIVHAHVTPADIGENGYNYHKGDEHKIMRYLYLLFATQYGRYHTLIEAQTEQNRMNQICYPSCSHQQGRRYKRSAIAWWFDWYVFPIKEYGLPCGCKEFFRNSR